MKNILSALRGWTADLTGRRDYHRYREWDDRARRLRAQCACILAAGATLGYLAIIVTVIDFTQALAVPFLAAEGLGLTIFIWFFASAWYPRFHRPDAPAAAQEHSVDVFVTSCGEPTELVLETLRAACDIDYPNKKVYLLDDGGNRELRKAAATFGYTYLARPARVHAKAGNLNYGLEHTDGDLVLVLDADQRPDKAIVSSLIGYFNMPKIAFVQTRQAFDVPPGDPFCNSDPLFYGVMQSGKDRQNSAFSCGSGALYRRTALREVGGFSTWNLVEDLHTSMNLHDAGWRSVYHNHALSIGTAPRTIAGVYRQRWQWAVDALRLFFWDNPFFRKGLTLSQKFQYSHVGVVYLFAGWAMPVFYVIPIIALLMPETAFLKISLWSYLVARTPALLLTNYAYAQAYRASDESVPLGQATNTWLGYFPVFMSATVKALTSPMRKPRYRVNEKRTTGAGGLRRFVSVAPQLTIVVMSFVAIPVGYFQMTGSLDLWAISSLWALGNARSVAVVCQAVWKQPKLG